MSDPNYGGNFCDSDGGLFIPATELRREFRQQPSADGDDEHNFPASGGKELEPDNFLPEEEKSLKEGAGPGPQNPDDPANDA